MTKSGFEGDNENGSKCKLLYESARIPAELTPEKKLKGEQPAIHPSEDSQESGSMGRL